MEFKRVSCVIRRKKVETRILKVDWFRMNWLE